MKKNEEEKNKIGRPKLADEELKKKSIKTIMLLCIILITSIIAFAIDINVISFNNMRKIKGAATTIERTNQFIFRRYGGGNPRGFPQGFAIAGEYYFFTFNPVGAGDSNTDLDDETQVVRCKISYNTTKTYRGTYINKDVDNKNCEELIDHATFFDMTHYTITLNANGGNLVKGGKKVTSASIKPAVNAAYGTLPTPTRSDYRFVGWFTSKSGGFDYKYYADTYADLKNAFGYNVAALKNHWYANGMKEGRQCSKDNVTKNTIATGSRTVYAAWERTNYTVTLDANGGNFVKDGKKVTSASIKPAANAAYGTLPTPTRSGYRFVGWFTSKGGNFDHTYYANNYEDLKKAFGYDKNKLREHWYTYGIKEGRQCSGNNVTKNTIATSSRTIYAVWEENLKLNCPTEAYVNQKITCTTNSTNAIIRVSTEGLSNHYKSLFVGKTVTTPEKKVNLIYTKKVKAKVVAEQAGHTKVEKTITIKAKTGMIDRLFASVSVAKPPKTETKNKTNLKDKLFANILSRKTSKTATRKEIRVKDKLSANILAAAQTKEDNIRKYIQTIGGHSQSFDAIYSNNNYYLYLNSIIDSSNNNNKRVNARVRFNKGNPEILERNYNPESNAAVDTDQTQVAANNTYYALVYLTYHDPYNPKIEKRKWLVKVYDNKKNSVKFDINDIACNGFDTYGNCFAKNLQGIDIYTKNNQTMLYILFGDPCESNKLGSCGPVDLYKIDLGDLSKKERNIQKPKSGLKITLFSTDTRKNNLSKKVNANNNYTYKTEPEGVSVDSNGIPYVMYVNQTNKDGVSQQVITELYKITIK